MTNAIKYTPTGGNITVSVAPEQKKMIRVGITDTGEGIAEDKIHLVFQKFGQVVAKKSGAVKSTGLGLTFCKMAVEAHGGEIGLNTEVGKGTTFWFTLHRGEGVHLDLQYAEKEQVIEKESIIFSVDEKRMLEPIINRLRAFTVYETDDIKEILAELKGCESENIRRWILQVESSMGSLNQSRFLELLKETWMNC